MLLGLELGSSKENSLRILYGSMKIKREKKFIQQTSKHVHCFWKPADLFALQNSCPKLAAKTSVKIGGGRGRCSNAIIEQRTSWPEFVHDANVDFRTMLGGSRDRVLDREE